MGRSTKFADERDLPDFSAAFLDLQSS